MAASNTGESRLIGTISFINTAAHRTGSGSISGVNSDNLNATEGAFVLDKVTKLEERPTMQSSPLGASNRNPFAEMGQVLNRYSASGALRFGYYFLTDTMVYVTREASFFSGEILQESPRRLRSFLLQFSSQFSMSVSDIFDCLTGKNLAIGINGDICNPKINAKKAFRINRRPIGKNAVLKQKKLTFFVNKVCLAFNSLKHLLPVRADNKRHYHPAGCAGDRNSVSAFVGQQPIVKNDSPVLLKDMQLLFVSAVHLNDLAYRPYCVLSREIKLLSDFVITGLVDFYLRRCCKIISNLRSKVAGLIKPFDSIKQFCGLFIGRQELDF